ncbi:hypothetical protein [Microbacterium sp. SORGH_AS_0421]|uniref:hypothetical protein n=1 Tax=Microbacterium sp. SORGH_AS_0421 TaxID=3041768 RepID=UPI0027920766|nr:hypothetical protein [Microbacterium sp. SORGH_AS_0421]MDQ1176887.1 hypothetical protein [Microbacterium sp. SORGH_AS_0421]
MILSAPRPLVGAIVWSRLDDDLSVARRDGDFAGYVDRRSPEAFFVFDGHARYVGTYADAATARSALGESAPSRRASCTVSWSRVLRALSSRLTPSNPSQEQM